MANKKQTSGFSIIEVPIALAIIAVIVIIYGAASNFLLLNKNAKEQDIANRIAIGKMEELRALGYDNLPSSGSFTHSLLSQLPNYTANITVTSYNTDTKEVTVTVTWQEPGKTTHTVTLSTLVNQNGL